MAASNYSLYCFTTSSFTGLNQGRLIGYRQDWATFNRVQLYDIAVSTARAAGNMRSPSNCAGVYYVFANSAEQTSFINGQMLHVRQYPFVDWATVPKN